MTETLSSKKQASLAPLSNEHHHEPKEERTMFRSSESLSKGLRDRRLEQVSFALG